jgi:ABC-type spermidine/putrescine transport system permease subunit II
MRDGVMVWLRITVTLGVFLVTCAGSGFLAGRWVRRRKWSPKVTAMLCVSIAFIWPAIAIGAAVYGMYHYERRGPNDPGDAPGMLLASVVFVGAPVLFALGLPLAVGGAFVASRRKPEIEGETG